MNYESYIFLLLAGASKGIMDLLNFRYMGTIFSKLSNRQYWDMKHSWKNKWLRGDPGNGEAFFGSSTFFVWMTDGWHMVQFFMIKFIFLAVLLHGKFSWIDLIGIWSYHAGFWVTYESRLLKL